MKKVFLLVAVFLVGNATQALANQKRDVVINQGKKHRYYKSQTIRFVENGVLYSVATDGTFDFKFLNRPRNYTYGRRGNQNGYVPAFNNGVQYVKSRRFGRNVQTDHYGNIVRIGRTYIDYKRNGRVRSIGSVPLRYERGLLRTIGGMHIIYNRFGEIRNVYGYVNHQNRKVWHDDWIVCNDQSHDHYIYDRLDLKPRRGDDRQRLKEIK